jgi:hypothetical protein
MNFGRRQPGTSVTFVDAESEESILQFASNADGVQLIAFHLYDSAGALVEEHDALVNYPDGVSVHSSGGELLLSVPKDDRKNIRYCLYNQAGALLTTSDGVRTKIYPRLRMEGAGRSWVGPARK